MEYDNLANNAIMEAIQDVLIVLFHRDMIALERSENFLTVD